MRRNRMKELGTPPILKRPRRVRKERCAACGMDSADHTPDATQQCMRIMRKVCGAQTAVLAYDESTNPSNGWRAPDPTEAPDPNDYAELLTGTCDCCGKAFTPKFGAVYCDRCRLDAGER